MNKIDFSRLGAQAEKQKLFLEKLRKVSPNIKEDVCTTFEHNLATLAYNFRLLCEKGYYNRYCQEDYIDYLEKEILCRILLGESVIDNEGILQ